MASAGVSGLSKQWVSTSPQVKLTAQLSLATDGAETVKCTIEYIASSAANTSVSKSFRLYVDDILTAEGTFDINGKTGTHLIGTKYVVLSKQTTVSDHIFVLEFDFNLTWSGSYKGTSYALVSYPVDAKTKYTITYNANGGSGAPSSQTKWHGQDLILSPAKPTRAGHVFQGWGTSSSGPVSYLSGATYTTDSSTTLYAIWKANTYSVQYNANGGSGAPPTQIKTHGTPLVLSNTKPVRQYYTFKGWGTSESTTIASYFPGDTFADNKTILLYAVWELSYVKPRITNLSIKRVDYSGSPKDDGTSAQISFDWEVDSSDYITIDIQCGDDTWSNAEWQTSGSYSVQLDSPSTSGFSVDNSYQVMIKISDGVGDTYVFGTLPGLKLTIDGLAGGNGIAFGKPAELDDVAEFAYRTKFTGGVVNEVCDKHNDLNLVTLPNVYVSKNQGASSYTNCPVTSGTFVLEVMSAGAEGQIIQRLTTTFKDGGHKTFIRHFYQGTWGNWVLTYSDTGWIDLTLRSGVTVGSEVGYLRGRLKDGVLYIRGDFKGITANWQNVGVLPSALIPDGLPTASRFLGVYYMSYFCGFSLQKSGQLYVSTNSSGAWDSAREIHINVAICI